MGSALHDVNECRPCAFFWKPQGCVHGADCGFCHMCLPGALKARKKKFRSEGRKGGVGGADED